MLIESMVSGIKPSGHKDQVVLLSSCETLENFISPLYFSLSDCRLGVLMVLTEEL